jgi:signal transduction histidine kinase
VTRRILVVVLTAVALAVTLLGVPLAFALREATREEEHGRLLVEAVNLQLELTHVLRHTDGTDLEIPDHTAGMHVAVYDGDGHLLAGEGPPEPDAIVQNALDGEEDDGFAGNDLVAAVPVMHDEDVIAVVRTSSRRGELIERDLTTFAAISGVAGFAALMAMLLALRLVVRLAQPIRDLQHAAEELGDGNFAIQAPISDIRELDAVSTSLNATAQRLGQLVDRERAFSANASHQLRTPLTALRLRLDTALASGDPRYVQPALTESIAIVDDLETTVEDLLAVSRGRVGGVSALDLDALLGGLPHRWQGLLATEGRALVIRQDDPPVAAGRAATVRQVLDVLIDNAYRHGGGTVQVVARDASGALALDVVDESRPGASDLVDAEFARISAGGRSGSMDRSGERSTDRAAERGADRVTDRRSGPRARSGTRRGGTGIGLGLARSLLVADGGRLLLTSSPGRTCATMLLPAVEADHAAPGGTSARKRGLSP